MDVVGGIYMWLPWLLVICDPPEDIPSSFDKINCCAVSGFEDKVERCILEARGGSDYAEECTALSNLRCS